jgi:hypothetical protein
MKMRSVLFLVTIFVLATAITFSLASDKEKKSADKKDSKGCCDMKAAKDTKEKCSADAKECSSDKASMKGGSKDCCAGHDMKEAKAKSSDEQPKQKDNEPK